MRSTKPLKKKVSVLQKETAWLVLVHQASLLGCALPSPACKWSPSSPVPPEETEQGLPVG